MIRWIRAHKIKLFVASLLFMIISVYILAIIGLFIALDILVGK